LYQFQKICQSLVKSQNSKVKGQKYKSKVKSLRSCPKTLFSVIASDPPLAESAAIQLYAVWDWIAEPVPSEARDLTPRNDVFGQLLRVRRRRTPYF